MKTPDSVLSAFSVDAEQVPRSPKSPRSPRSPRSPAKTPPMSPTQPVFNKPHISGALKHLPDEESQNKALEAMVKYKKMFANKKFEPVMDKLETFAEEDHMRLPEEGQKAVPTPAERPRPAPISTPARERALSNSRERWNFVPKGPMTPLSPAPTSNAFSSTGYWKDLTSPAKSPPAQKTPTGPAPAPQEPLSPFAPTTGQAAVIYKQLKANVEDLARVLCTTRLSMNSSLSGTYQVPATMVTSRDRLKAAELILEAHQLDLNALANSKLPQKLESLAKEESELMTDYSVKSSAELRDLDNWLHVDDKTLEFNTIVDSQRDLVRILRERRASLLKLDDAPLRLIWATRIFEDAELAVEAERGTSGFDEDEGYDYSNFLRSIKREVSGTEEDQLTTLVEELELSGRESRGTSKHTSAFESARSRASSRVSSDSVCSKSQHMDDNTAQVTDHHSRRSGRSARSTSAPRSNDDLYDSPGSPTGPLDQGSRSRASSRVSSEHSSSSLEIIIDTSPQLPSQRSSTSRPSANRSELPPMPYLPRTNDGFHDPPSSPSSNPFIPGSHGYAGLPPLPLPPRNDNDDLYAPPSSPATPVEKDGRRKGANPVDLDLWTEEVRKMKEREPKQRVSAASELSTLVRESSSEYFADVSSLYDEFVDAESVGGEGANQGGGSKEEGAASKKDGGSKEKDGGAESDAGFKSDRERSSFGEKYGYKYLTGPIPLPGASGAVPLPATSARSSYNIQPASTATASTAAASAENVKPTSHIVLQPEPKPEPILKPSPMTAARLARRQSMSATFHHVSLESDEEDDKETEREDKERKKEWLGELARMEETEMQRQIREHKG